MKIALRLFLFELRTLARSPVLWLTSLLLGTALVAGAFNTRALHLEQNAAITSAEQSQGSWYAELEQRAARYAQPAPEQLPYWQDPTDVSGFSSYFLRAHAAKPHLPLSVLSAGQSDLLPYLLPLSLETPFGIEPAYDFEAPRHLALGNFDTGFVLVYLLPIALIVLVALLGAYERDHGLLRMVAMQTGTPRLFLAFRLLALSVMFIPITLLLLSFALLASAVPLASALPAFLSALVLVAFYAVFWLTAGFLALALQRGAAATAGILMGAWLLLVLGLPLGANLLIDAAAPAPSRVLYVDTLRRVDDALSAERSMLVSSWLMANSRNPAAPVPTYAAEMTIIAPEREKRLASVEAERQSHQDAQEFWNRIINILSPPLAMQQTLAGLAGTDDTRHDFFLEATRTYQQELRDFFYPRVQAEILQVRPPACADCAGKLQFTGFTEIPRFEFQYDPKPVQRAAVLKALLQLLLCSAALSVAACMRARAWRADDIS